MKKIIPIIIFIVILINVTFISANFAPPQFFNGIVKYLDGRILPDGYVITAKINGFGGSTVRIINGQYENLQIRPPFGTTGKVYFLINGTEAITTADFNRGHTTELDVIIDELFIPQQKFCGDNICDENENCSICPSDCEECPIEYCGDGSCNNGETCLSCSQDCGKCQTNDDGNNNGDNPNRGSSIIITDGTTDLPVTDEEETIDLNSNDKQDPTGSGITGSVIGFLKSGGGLVAMIFVILIIVIGIGVIVIQKKPKTSKNDE